MKNISFKQVFKGYTNVLGNRLRYPQTETPEVERWVVTLPPQSVGEWHIHLVPEFFYVEKGMLYVVNELKDKSLAVTRFNKGDHGLTDCHVPQFIWNPDKELTVKLTATYFGCSDIKPTKGLGKKPSQKILNDLLNNPIKNNLTEINNQAREKGNSDAIS